MYTLKILKSKKFQANGTDETHYTLAYKGRVFGLSTLRWSEDKDSIEVKDNTLTIKGDIDIIKNSSVDKLTGEVSSYLDIVPKIGLTLSDF